MNRLTRGALEAEVANAVVKFHREQQGRGPHDVRAHITGCMVVVRSTGIFTPTEMHLAGSEEGRRLIRSSRQELRAIAHCEIERSVADILGCNVLFSYYDINVPNAEQIEVYILDVDVEQKLRT